MSKKGVEQKHSETAIMAALHRTLANKEFKTQRFGPDYLAEYFLPAHFRFFLKFKKVRINARDKLNRFMPGLYEYMIGRTAFFDTIFLSALKENIPQIVLLGAGYDTRPYRFAEVNNTTKIIELDIETTQKRKIKCLKKTGISIPKHVTLVPIDFNKESLKTVLEKAGYEQHKKTLFIWEGICYYLTPESVDATLEFVYRSSNKESVIAFDYAVSISEDTINNYYGVKEFTQSWKKHHANEVFRFTIDEGKIESFLAQRDLKIINHLDNSEIEKRFLLKENGSLIGHITGLFRFAEASPLH